MNKDLTPEQLEKNKELVLLRKQLGDTQAALAVRVGFKVETIRAWERNRNPAPEIVLLYLRKVVKSLTS
jgi:DNA-binding transcriptional regulator YiaG